MQRWVTRLPCPICRAIVTKAAATTPQTMQVFCRETFDLQATVTALVVVSGMGSGRERGRISEDSSCCCRGGVNEGERCRDRTSSKVPISKDTVAAKDSLHLQPAQQLQRQCEHRGRRDTRNASRGGAAKERKRRKRAAMAAASTSIDREVHSCKKKTACQVRQPVL